MTNHSDGTRKSEIQRLYQRSEVLWKEGKYAQCKAICFRLLSIDNRHSDGHNRLANCHNRLGCKECAIKHFKLAIKWNKLNKSAFNNLANLYSGNIRTWASAQQCYIKAIAIDPSYSSSHANFGVLLRKMNRPEDAKYHYLRAMKNGAGNAWIHFNFANLMFDCFGDTETAAIHYRKCLEIDDKYSDAYHNYGVLLQRCHRLGEAQIYYEKALQFRSNMQCALTNRNYAILLVTQKKYVAALHHLEVALHLHLKGDETFAWNDTVDIMEDMKFVQDIGRRGRVDVDRNMSSKGDILRLAQHILCNNLVEWCDFTMSSVEFKSLSVCKKCN